MSDGKNKIKKRIISLYPKEEEYEKPQYFEKSEEPIQKRKDKEDSMTIGINLGDYQGKDRHDVDCKPKINLHKCESRKK